MTVPSGPPPGAGRREGAVVEARVASMVAQSEAVMATGVALVMGSGIAAMAAVNGGRLGGGGGLDRARGVLLLSSPPNLVAATGRCEGRGWLKRGSQPKTMVSCK